MSRILRTFIKSCISEGKRKIAASPEYMKKEAVMQQIQRELATQVRSGKIKKKEDMDKWLDFYLVFLPSRMDRSAAELAVNTLKSIPDPLVFLLSGSVASEAR